MNPAAISDQVLHILLALLDEPRHGYAIATEIEARTAGAVRVGTGTLYTALKRLRAAGLIEEVADPSPDASARARRTYRLTERGRSLIHEQTERLRALVQHARSKRAFTDPEPI